MNKINLDIIKKFKHCFQYNREIKEDDYDLFIDKKTKNKVSWLYISYEQEAKLIGIKDGIVNAVDTMAYCFEICEGVENIPYEMLRIATNYSENESVEIFLQRDKNFAQDLIAYENWCKENNIELDKKGIYHDSEGKLFTHYFRRPGEYLYE